MSLDGSDAAPLDPVKLAAELRAVEPGAGYVPLLTERFPGLTWDDARAVAVARDELRRQDGETQIGYKLGWTSSAMREALGIKRPNWGTLWAGQRLGPSMRLADYRHPKVEPELVYIAGADLVGDVDLQQVQDEAAGWAVGLEIVDPRFVDFGFDWLDNTADNSSAAGIAIGQTVAAPASDPAQWTLSFTDGTEERTGRGEVVMGSPLEAVAWLVRSLAEIGERLAEGMIVFTGGMAAPFDVAGGSQYHAVSPELEAEVTLTAE